MTEQPPDIESRLICLHLWRIQLEQLLRGERLCELPMDVKIVRIEPPEPYDHMTAYRIMLRSAEFIAVPDGHEPPIAHIIYGEIFIPKPPEKIKTVTMASFMTIRMPDGWEVNDVNYTRSLLERS